MVIVIISNRGIMKEEAEKFAKAAEEFNRKAKGGKQPAKGGKQPTEKATLGGAAQEFAENSAKLAEKMKPAEPTLESVPTQNEGFAGAAKDLNARMYANTYIIPKIDGLINSHNDGSGIPKNEIESTFIEVMSQMVADGIMTPEELTAYTAPSRVETQQKVDTGQTKQVAKHKEDRGLLNQAGNFLSGKKTEMETVKIYRTETIIVDGPSKFQEDINNSMKFNKEDKLESPNLESFKDKLMNTLGNICNSLGLKDLAQSCRQSISKPNLEKTYAAEKGMSNLTSKVAEQAKQIGKKAGTPEAERVSARTQDTLAKRQGAKQDSGRGR